MTGILSDQPVTRTDEFEGRRFPVRQGAEQEYWQCDRCSRNYATIVAAARCANPNHSQIFGPRPERRTEPDLAAKANGGRRAGEESPVTPKPPAGRPKKYATDAERAAAHREQSNRHYDRKVAEKRGAWQDHVAAVQETLPTNGRVTSWTEERKKQHAESMRRHHEQRRAAKAAAAPPPPPPEKEAPVPEHVNGRNKIEWTPERRAAHGALMKRKAAEKRATSAAMAPASSTHTPKSPNADQKPQKAMAPPRTNLEAVDVTAPAPCVVDITVPGDGRVLRVTDQSIVSAMNVLNTERDNALGQARKLEQAVCLLAETFGVEVPA